MSETIEEKCLSKGVKLTDQRRIIARVMSESSDHPDVDELYERVSKIDSKISIATVYRTVKLFEESGILAKHEFKGGKARYEELNEGHHDHLIDVKSGEIIEFVDEEIETLQKKVAEKYGYTLVDHKLELYGVKKSKTKISDNVFVGSNSSLVAPVSLDKNSVIGAGSVITKNVKKNTLALTRSTQHEIKNYKRKKK